MSALIDQELQARGVAEVIVVLEPDAVLQVSGRDTPAGTIAASEVAGAKTLATHFQVEATSQMAQLIDADLTAPARLATATRARRATRRGRAQQPRYYPNLGVMLGTVGRAGLAKLRSDPRVSTVTGAPPISLIRPDRKGTAHLSDRVTWGIRALGVERLWKEGLSGEGILVGHLDTGADGRHPALRAAISHFAEFDALGREVRPSRRPYDTDDHGTHTAATIAGRPVRRRHIGVAPGADLASAIVIEGGEVIARVLGGLEWAMGHGVRILSLSLGFRGWWDDFRPIVDILRRRDILPVFAVGNEGPGTSRSPGNYPEALSVGAHDRRSRVCGFSSSQRFRRAADPIVPDLVAPGASITSARPGRGYQAMDGTSMATPHIAGLAALLMEAYPDRSVDRIEEAILCSCRRPSGMQPGRANRGIPDAVRALELLA